VRASGRFSGGKLVTRPQFLTPVDEQAAYPQIRSEAIESGCA
jgi:hypothetical protein